MSIHDLQASVQRTIDDGVASGAEVGVQVAVAAHGELVVDAVAGLADPGRSVPVRPDTLFFAFSAAKGIASAVAHVLGERGELADGLRAADVWPELGAHGKDEITLRHVLLHTAGVPAPPYDTTIDDLCDWDRMCARLADEMPWWPPGTRFGYHAQTFGFILGEIVRRATGNTLSGWLHEAITQPLGIPDDVHFGVPSALLGRIARQVAAGTPPPSPEPGSPADRAIPPGVRIDAAAANRTDLLTSDIPSFGTMTARGAARVYAALLGHVDGIELVSPARRTTMGAIHVEGLDEVMGFPSTWAYGFAPHRPGPVASRPGSTFGMFGSNGCAAYADIDSGVAVAVLRNRFDSSGFAAAAEIDRLVAEAFPTNPAP